MSALRWLIVVAACCAGSVLAPAKAYEIATHQDLTGAAVARSVLATSATLSDLGLKGVSDEAQKFPNSTGTTKTILDLFRDGAEFEDDWSLLGTKRPLRHFYNPINGQGLSAPPLLSLQLSSPDWALARPGTVPEQERSYWNAKKWLFDALTEPLEADRRAAFGKAFQFLGQVVHHLQDMAQPQHVRNDAHCDWWPCSELVGSGRSRYETWTNEVRGTLPKDPPIGYNLTSLAFTSVFNSPRRFWHTETGQNSVDAGKGIAEFTNRNFVSYGTNFDKPGLFPSPVREMLLPQVDISTLCLGRDWCSNLSGHLTLHGNTVRDRFLGSSADEENLLASTYSTFDQDLINRGGTPTFSLNRFNFEVAHSYLIPRAVAYSAGMINYFFRGKIDLVEDPSNAGTYLIKNLGNEDMSGEFSLYYDDAAGVRTRHIGPLNISVPANDQQLFSVISTPTSPAPKTPGEYILVFKGNMGGETTADFGAVVGKVVNIAPWTITDLGAGTARGINNSGQVVGVNPVTNSAFLWSPGSGALDLGPFVSPCGSDAYGINSSGQVVGLRCDPNDPGIEHAFVWSSASGTLDLGSNTFAYDISDSGQVVGWRRSAWDAYPFAFLWSGGSFQDLDTLGSRGSVATAISSNGQIVVGGIQPPPDFAERAFLWAGAMQVLDALPGWRSWAVGVNDVGQVAVQGSDSFGTIARPFLWSSTSGWQDLGVFAEGHSIAVQGINNSGQVVGTDFTSGYRPVLWSNGVMKDLNTVPGVPGSGWVLYEAHAINNAGQIVGWGLRNNQARAFLLTPPRTP